MFYGAVSRPVPQCNASGAIGLWLVGSEKVAGRSSKYHDKGDKFTVPGTMNEEKFVEMTKTKVVPAALRALGSFAREIRIQADNAGGHGGGRGNINETSLRRLSVWAKSLSHAELEEMANRPTDDEPNVPQPPVRLRPGICVTFCSQPARSPDLNMLDLGIWWSIGAGVTEMRQRRKDESGADFLVGMVREQWLRWRRDLATEKLQKVHEVLAHGVFPQVRLNNGGNKFKIPHVSRERTACEIGNTVTTARPEASSMDTR